MLKKYGEAADVADLRDMGFQMVLGDYAITDVQRAFMTYLKTGKEIPTPADIVEIMEPSVKPLCPKVYQRYLNLSKESRFNLTREEWRYVEEYERQQLNKLRN